MEYGARSGAENKLVWVGILGIIGLLIAFVAYTFWPNMSAVTVTIGPKTFHAQVADTEERRQVGLTNLATLRDDQALLMVYASEDVWPVQTKGMKVPIDIVWLGGDKRVAYLAKDARPSATSIYRPGGKSRYILQLPAGSVAQYGISVGKSVEFTYGEDV